MRTKKVYCACGLPLHYRDKAIEAKITKMSEELGEYMPVTVGEDRYMVQRHYIALHGIKAPNLPMLLEKRIVRRG